MSQDPFYLTRVNELRNLLAWSDLMNSALPHDTQSVQVIFDDENTKTDLCLLEPYFFGVFHGGCEFKFTSLASPRSWATWRLPSYPNP